MQTTFFLATIGSWARAVSSELSTIFNEMNTIQWGIVAVCAVGFGFLCLKSTGVNR